MLSTRTGTRGLDFLISRSTSRPLRPGIVMSSTTTSQCSFQTRSSASWALRASPKMARLNSSARICFSPRRTTAWSSVNRIFMVNRGRIRRVRYRHGDAHSCAFAAAQAADFENSAQQRRAFTHAQQPHRFGIGDFLPRNTAPIVFHIQSNAAVGLFQMDADLGSAGMTDHVGERFLEYAEK